MLKCNKCGSVVTEMFCNNCGTPVNSQSENLSNIQEVSMQSNNNGLLVVNRKNSFVGIDVNIAMTIDGSPFQLCNNQQFSFSLTPGVHTITYKVWCRRTKTVQINVVPGGNYLIDFVADWLWGGFKLSKNSKLQ